MGLCDFGFLLFGLHVVTHVQGGPAQKICIVSLNPRLTSFRCEPAVTSSFCFVTTSPDAWSGVELNIESFGYAKRPIGPHNFKICVKLWKKCKFSLFFRINNLFFGPSNAVRFRQILSVTRLVLSKGVSNLALCYPSQKNLSIHVPWRQCRNVTM